MKTKSYLIDKKNKLMYIRNGLSVLFALGMTTNVSSVDLSSENIDFDEYKTAVVDEVHTSDCNNRFDEEKKFIEYSRINAEQTYLSKRKIETIDPEDIFFMQKQSLETLKEISDIATKIRFNPKEVGDSLSYFCDAQMDFKNDDMIYEFSNIYYLDYDTVNQLYLNNKKEIDSSENPKKTFIVMVKNLFYQTDIDKTPIVSNKTREEKEDYIIHMAKDIYGVEDRELLALILAIHRLETGNSTSRRCIYDNNLGGVTDAHGFLTFKTFEIGAECFVRTVTNRVNEAYASPYYDWDLPIEYNIQEVYCDSSWGPQINPIKVSILNNGELDKYFNDKKYTLK